MSCDAWFRVRCRTSRNTIHMPPAIIRMVTDYLIDAFSIIVRCHIPLSWTQGEWYEWNGSRLLSHYAPAAESNIAKICVSGVNFCLDYCYILAHAVSLMPPLREEQVVHHLPIVPASRLQPVNLPCEFSPTCTSRKLARMTPPCSQDQDFSRDQLSCLASLRVALELSTLAFQCI